MPEEARDTAGTIPDVWRIDLPQCCGTASAVVISVGLVFLCYGAGYITLTGGYPDMEMDTFWKMLLCALFGLVTIIACLAHVGMIGFMAVCWSICWTELKPQRYIRAARRTNASTGEASHV